VRLTLSQSKSVAALAESLGTPLEPDARYTGKSYPWDAHVAVLRLSETPILPQGKAFALAAVIARLAVEIPKRMGRPRLMNGKRFWHFLRSGSCSPPMTAGG